jgi:hypothetical protein
VVKRALLLVAVAACGRFQDPDIVVDLRVLAMVADPPDQLVEVDLQNPNAGDLLAQLVPTRVCALVSDPNFTRRLRWTMSVCNLDSAGRCTDPSYPIYPADGSCSDANSPCFTEDMDKTIPEPQLCATIPPDGNLVGVLVPIVQGDTFKGLGGVIYGVSLEVGGEGADPDLDLFAGRSVVVTPHIPAARTANNNPVLLAGEPFDASVNSGTFLPLPMGRCADLNAAGGTQLVVAPGDVVRIAPIETPQTRETYTVPTLDGGMQTFTEAVTYQWVAGAGSFGNDSTGGGHDAFGNYAPTYTDWTAPSGPDAMLPKDVPLWIVQRDERYGAAWYETCVHVTAQ